MEPCWEYRWAHWDRDKGRFALTSVWMTEDEARADWHAYGLPDSIRVQHTRRDRDRNTGPLVVPPEERDWTRERRRCEEVSRYGLPPFFTPTYEELRKI